MRPGIARAYSIPMLEPLAILAGTAIMAMTSMYIIRKNSTAETSLEKNPKADQNLVYLHRRSMVLKPSLVLIMMHGPYLQRWYLDAFSGHLHTQTQIGT